jgi:predicted dienelactone hydrolase
LLPERIELGIHKFVLNSKCFFKILRLTQLLNKLGMDEAGLRQLTVPTYIVVGARDTQTPPQENAEFAARNIPHAELNIIPGAVDHEIFVNECSEDGKNELPEACVDAPGVDRHKIHEVIGNAAVTFYDASLNVPRGK